MAPVNRCVLYPPSLPPADFDPVNNVEDRKRLEEFWLPSYPDPEREPELHEHWKEMFAQPRYHDHAYVKTQPMEPPTQPFVTTLPPNTRRLRSLVRQVHPATTGDTETSRNWSGAYLLPNRGERFTRVAGRWTVPEVRPGVASDQAQLPFRCSIWIGLDGKKGWTGSMPQVGTVHTLPRAGAPETPKLWWQWWVRNELSEPQDIPGVPIKAGDVVLCSLIVISPNQVRFHVKNRNTGRFAGLTACEPVPLLGSSAEWMVEQPADPQRVGGRIETGPSFPLPDYGSVLFERCAARAGPEPAPGGNGQYRPLRSPQLVRLTQTLRRPTRSAVVSIPRRRGEPPGGFKVTYRDP